jgi:hypothetical protein
MKIPRRTIILNGVADVAAVLFMLALFPAQMIVDRWTMGFVVALICILSSSVGILLACQSDQRSH